ncbi:MAG: helix-turn-helix transcriptional regulator [Hyphomonadaceae bacterium]|nr:helix-turn-helix transcriptional regulator [Hyphomonadaceae bacterium]
MASPPYKARTASLHDDAYASFVEKLIQKRVKAGFSQQALADALGWNQSIIAKIESVQRRLDVIELVRIANVLGIDASRLVKDAQQKMHGP